MDIGCHVVDILDFMFGPMQNIQGDALQMQDAFPENLEVETAVNCVFRTHHGALGTMMFNFAGPLGFREDILRVSGTQGIMTMSIFGSEPPTLQRPAKNASDGKVVLTP